MKDWVGGRFSLWSSVGLSIALSIGPSNFEKLLNGAKDMDKHFKNSDFKKNIPVTLALISIWYNNFYDAETEAIIPYTEYLNKFPSYLQQAVMESNGKSLDALGNELELPAAPLVFGEIGTESQHSFFQLLHQGIEKIPVEFLVPFEGKNTVGENQKERAPHSRLVVNAIAQAEALINGKQTHKEK